MHSFLTVPEDFSLHYHGVILQLYRCLLTPETSLPDKRWTVPTALRQIAQEKCLQSAWEINRLQQAFREKHGLNHLQAYSIQPLLAASIINIGAVPSTVNDGKGKRIKALILRSISTFGEIAQTMDVASRALEIVLVARRDWLELEQ